MPWRRARCVTHVADSTRSLNSIHSFDLRTDTHRLRGHDGTLRPVHTTQRKSRRSKAAGDCDFDLSRAAGTCCAVAVIALGSLMTSACGNESDGHRREHQTHSMAESQSNARYISSGEWAKPLGPIDEDAAGLPARVRRVRDEADMILIAAGSFMMGPPEGDRTAYDEETPRHQVFLTSPYYLDVAEVTNGQFSRFVSATNYRTVAEIDGYSVVGSADGRTFERRSGAMWRTRLHEAMPDSEWVRCPVVLVSYADAAEYAKWVGGELPTEAQFENALRGRSGAESVYPWGDAEVPPRDYGNYFGVECRRGVGYQSWAGIINGYDDKFQFVAPVHSFQPNAAGIFDLSGNVHEFVRDWYGEHYYKVGTSTDPSGPSDGTERVIRGGSFESGIVSLHVYRRGSVAVKYRGEDLGFRVSRTMPKGE